MKRTFYLVYGTLAYLAFLGTILYAIGFVGNFLVSNSIDRSPSVSLWRAVILNGCALTLFVVFQGFIARPVFKEWWTKFIPRPLERISYVLFTSLYLLVLLRLWQPMGGVIWKIENE